MVVVMTDSRKQPLVFKASVYELNMDLLLVEFRRSKVSNSVYVAFHTYRIIVFEITMRGPDDVGVGKGIWQTQQSLRGARGTKSLI